MFHAIHHAHVIRIITSEHDALSANMTNHELQNRGRVQDGIVIEAFRDIRRLFGDILFGLRSHLPSVLPSRGLVVCKSTAMSKHDCEPRMPVKDPAEIKTGRADRCVEWISDEVVQIIGLHAIGAGHIVWLPIAARNSGRRDFSP